MCICLLTVELVRSGSSRDAMVKNEVQVLNSAESAIKCWPSHSIDLAIIMLCRSQNSAGSTSPHVRLKDRLMRSKKSSVLIAS